MNLLVALPVVLPLLAAGLSIALRRYLWAQRSLSTMVLVAVLTTAFLLLVLADRRGPLVLPVGGWEAPAGITLVADCLSALLLTVSLLVALAVLLFSMSQGTAERRGRVATAFHPAYLLLAGGVGLAFLTGDLFNLFVAFEVMLGASYVLITLNAGTQRTRAGMTYVLVSLTSSLLFITAIALVYAATGTVNLAQLGERTAALPDGLRTALGLLLLVVFGIKSAMVPLHFWLPDSYPTAPAPITAVFAALLTKVGVYAMVRTQTLLFPREETWVLLAVLAVATMLLGILGALAQDDINRLLSFTLVSHIGFMLFGLALFDVAGLTGTILYIVHHIVVQATLFLVAGLIVRGAGTPALRRMEGRTPPPALLALLFLVPALSLSGIPPLSGFVAKLALLRAGAADGGAAAYALVAAALLTSLLTLAAMARLGRSAFSGAPRPDPRTPPAPAAPRRPARLMAATTAGMALAGVTLVVLAGPLAGISERAAEDLLDRDPYRSAVLVTEAKP
ncbi:MULTISPECIES: Na+/H+ antiporter subunit D [Streptomyces]|uniref:Na+/H+ antiporter subunit D n=2 Tax=Streptomyces TaxID=1883 RepID=A0A3R7HY40_9ACTN|nr:MULTISPECIES: Na+/H+ antiporter subunit D [Streptomyces]KNE78924.1 cation:proton antiporter [Streptomyces fradiae]OFA47348.1 Na+/H+ antiporter subunit D [Streptomyces fradiae]PQM21755.1 Na+/H+ antiporter subunit D [Streptomyces xinghaiensis]RKM93188.1 Na+/H+ antiporter subunit D [Streptomyces xinghaiensis]RNC71214.1 Na+/H+ antiporter subunit D [Streptomyces xinghaiensis]